MKLPNPARWDGLDWLMAVLVVAAICSICQCSVSFVNMVTKLSGL